MAAAGYCAMCDTPYCRCKLCWLGEECDPCGDADYRDTEKCPASDNYV